jgi:hypothetical protein
MKEEAALRRSPQSFAPTPIQPPEWDRCNPNANCALPGTIGLKAD